MDVILEDTGRRGQVVVIGDRGVHMYSYAIIMYLCVCGAVYMYVHVARCRLFNWIANGNVLLIPSV